MMANWNNRFDGNNNNISKVLVLYTGGTIGMQKVNGAYEPIKKFLPTYIQNMPTLNNNQRAEVLVGNDFSDLLFVLPMIDGMNKEVVYYIKEYDPLLDSSDMSFKDWERIARDIKKYYDEHDGFVVLHGTDTMAYTASALSFMFENLSKPVVLTGAQIPMGETRTDGTYNLIGALIIAGCVSIPEVTIYFRNQLLRGNRSTKLDNQSLSPYASPNMEALVEFGYSLVVRNNINLPAEISDDFRVQELNHNIGILFIYPNISIHEVKSVLERDGVVIRSYGAGNIPSLRTDILNAIKEAVKKNRIIINVTQCAQGRVDNSYHCGQILYENGVIAGNDMTTEAAFTKLAYVLNKHDWDINAKRNAMRRNLRGEITLY